MGLNSGLQIGLETELKFRHFYPHLLNLPKEGVFFPQTKKNINEDQPPYRLESIRFRL